MSERPYPMVSEENKECSDGSSYGDLPDRRWRVSVVDLSSPQPSRRWDLLAIGAIAVGALVRAIWVFALHPPFDFVYSDMANYVGGAMEVATGVPPAQIVRKAPGTHLLLALPLKVLGVERAGLMGATVFWWTMSCLTPLLAWKLARQLLSAKAAAITALLTALYPLYISHVGYYSAETPATFLLLAVLVLAVKVQRSTGRRSVVLALPLGVAMGLIVIARPQLLLNGLIALAPLLARVRERLLVLACVAVAAAALIVPTLVLTTRTAGRFVGFGEYDGAAFFLGQCDVYEVTAGNYVGSRPTAIQLGIEERRRFPDHSIGDKGFFLDLGLDCIRDRGIGHLALMARNVWDMGGSTIPWPQAYDPSVRDITALTNRAYSLLLPLVVVATLVGWRRERQSGASSVRGLLLLHLACVLPTALVFFGDPRFRAPYDVFGLILMAAAIADWRLLVPAREHRDRQPNELIGAGA